MGIICILCVLMVSAHMCVHIWNVHPFVCACAGRLECTQRSEAEIWYFSSSPPHVLRQSILLSLEPTNSVKPGRQQTPESLQPQLRVLGYGNMLFLQTLQISIHILLLHNKCFTL